MRRWQWLGALAAPLAIGVGLAALVPKPAEVLEVRVRSADVHEAVRLLEQARVAKPDDAAIADRLVTAYEREQAPGRALAVLAERGRHATLTPQERKAARRLALASGHPEKALGVLAGPHEALGVPEREELIELALAAGRPDLALGHQRAIAALTPSEGVLARWVSLAQAAGSPKEAVLAQSRLVAAHPTSATVTRLIDLQLAAGDPKGALATLESHPHGPDEGAWHRRAIELAGWSKQPARAVPHRWALFQVHPTPEDGLALALALDAAKDPRAIAFAQGLAERYPTDATARDHLLGLWVRTGHLDAARTWLAARAQAQPDDMGAHKRYVDFLLANGDRQGALTALENWLGDHPGDRRALHQLAVVEVWDGHPAEGWDTYARLFSGPGPADELAARWRAEWAAISGPLEDFTAEGTQNLRALVAARPDDLALRRRLAAAEMEAGDRAPAIADQRRVAAHAEATGDDALTLAEWLLWDGRTAEGVALLLKLDATSPLPAPVLADAVEQAANARRFEDAARLLSRRVAHAPTDTVAWEALARSREAANDDRGASEAWARRLALGGTDAGRRSLAVGLLLRHGREAEALALLETHGDTVLEWRLAATLAQRLAIAA